MGSPRGAAAKGKECPPRQVEAPPPLGFPTLGAWGPKGGAPAHYGLVPSPLQPMGPFGIGGPTRWTTGTLPVVPVQYRLPPKLSRWPKLDFLYINLHLRTIPEFLMTSGISSETLNNFMVTVY